MWAGGKLKSLCAFFMSAFVSRVSVCVCVWGGGG